jgi:hypothetical protein
VAQCSPGRSGVEEWRMNKSELHEQLTQLHAELKAAPRLDASANRLLDEIGADIARLRGDGAEDATVDASLSDRLERVAIRFEIDHPTLAASSRRLIDILGKVGL